MGNPQKHKIGDAVASPTKAFFVNMLTRDIELEDAILDLLDNCLDGILRSGAKTDDPTKPYSGYRTKLEMDGDHFVIEDNCGGIPLNTAKKYAFAMGRPEGAEDPLPSGIGMYGIGMKRAIFKLGTEAIVESYNDTGFEVVFSSSWMSSNVWDDLPIFELEDGKMSEKGTRVTVFELNDEAKALLSDPSWVDNFRAAIARHYSLIIAKGFEVRVGSPEEHVAGIEPIAAEPFKLLTASGADNDKPVIEPFIYTGSIDGVNVEIIAGLYRKLLNLEELEREEETRGRRDDAGWTVACNDRVVIWKDKTRLTGWGEATVPNYHGQFIPITGIVLLSSTDDPRKLPLTTTKRGIDASSNIYLSVKDLMREATKSLTSFTNKWKKFPDQLDTLYRESRYVDLPEIRRSAATLPSKPVRKMPSISKYEPTYPLPAQERTSARVSFIAEKKEISLLAQYFFETLDVKNDEVGRKAFDQALEAARSVTK